MKVVGFRVGKADQSLHQSVQRDKRPQLTRGEAYVRDPISFSRSNRPAALVVNWGWFSARLNDGYLTPTS